LQKLLGLTQAAVGKTVHCLTKKEYYIFMTVPVYRPRCLTKKEYYIFMTVPVYRPRVRTEKMFDKVGENAKKEKKKFVLSKFRFFVIQKLVIKYPKVL
jgi:hypothetical protein